jgi:hypothetical protein
MDATPFEQVEAVALAIYVTGEVTVAPFLGAVTVTVANAAGARASDRTRTYADFTAFTPDRGRATARSAASPGYFFLTRDRPRKANCVSHQSA